jgi:hypothetical protein
MHLRRALLYPALVSAVAVAVVLIPSAGANNGDPLLVGSALNTATLNTIFNTTGALGLSVNDSTAGAVALSGVVSAATGNTTAGVYGENDSTGLAAAGVFGELPVPAPGAGTGPATSAGVRGVSFTTTANGPGVYGLHRSAAGVAPGVLGETGSTAQQAVGVGGVVTSSSSGLLSAGVRGINNGTGDPGVGVLGQTAAGGFGVFGFTPTGGAGVAGLMSSAANLGYGVIGQANTTAVNAAGVYGTINSNADYSGGVRGENFNASCCGFGVVGFHAGQGIGIGGYAPNGFGVFGWSPNNWAAYFDGAVEVVNDLHVNGTVFKGAGAFRIDNPLDPAHSYLQHSFVESPDMKNVYDGNVTTNAKGFATVTLPKWFQALNRDFRYQLTPIGHNAWGARAVVWNEIKDNRFTIRSEPHVKISWQVTGVRQDPYANAHRIQVVVPKEGSAEGKYMHPQLYGQPQSKSETALPGIPRKMPKLKAPASPLLTKQP